MSLKQILSCFWKKKYFVLKIIPIKGALGALGAFEVRQVDTPFVQKLFFRFCTQYRYQKKARKNWSILNNENRFVGWPKNQKNWPFYYKAHFWPKIFTLIYSGKYLSKLITSFFKNVANWTKNKKNLFSYLWNAYLNTYGQFCPKKWSFFTIKCFGQIKKNLLVKIAIFISDSKRA